MALPAEFTPNIPPFAHQLECIERSWRRRGFAFLMEMGTGKTKVLIDTFCLLYTLGEVDVLIVFAPKGVYSNWTKPNGELDKHMWTTLKASTVTHMWVSGKTKRAMDEQRRLLHRLPPGPRILVVNTEAMSSATGAAELCRQLAKRFKTLGAVDESTTIANPKSTRTKEILKVGDVCMYRRIMTGTPSKGSPSHLFSQFEFVEHASLGHRSFTTFRARYCKLKEITVAGGRTVKIEDGTQNIEELARIIERHSYKKLKSECFDLPPKVYMRREVAMSVEQQRVYDELRRHANAELGGGTLVTTQIVLTQLLRLHQVLCGFVRADDGAIHEIPNNRLSELDAVLDEVGDTPGIIWCNYQPNIHAVVKLLKKRCGDASVAEWHGGVPQKYREYGEDRWKAGEAQWLVASQSAGGRGRQWDRAALVMYFSNNHDLELREQSEDRAHRYGLNHSVTYLDFVIPKTKDEEILDALSLKKDVVAAIMGRDRGNWF